MFHGSAKDAVGEVWEFGETASREAWDGVEATGQLADDATRELGGALVIDPAREITSVIGQTDEAVRDLTAPVGEGLGDIGEGSQQLLARTGSGLESTGEGLEGLGTWGGIGITTLVVIGLAVVAFLYTQGDL